MAVMISSSRRGVAWQKHVGPSPVTSIVTVSGQDRSHSRSAELIRSALARHRGDVRATVEALGVPRKTLHDKLRKHGLNFADAAGAHNSAEELD